MCIIIVFCLKIVTVKKGHIINLAVTLCHFVHDVLASSFILRGRHQALKLVGVVQLAAREALLLGDHDRPFLAIKLSCYLLSP